MGTCFTDPAFVAKLFQPATMQVPAGAERSGPEGANNNGDTTFDRQCTDAWAEDESTGHYDETAYC